MQTAANSLDANKSDSDHTHSYAGSSSAGGAANELINREQFSITNTTSARYKYIKLGKVSTSNSGSRAMIQLIGRSSYNDMEAGGKVEICLSCNDAINTNNCRIGALVFAYGNSASNSTVTNTWATDVLIVRAEGYSMAEADVYLKFTSDANFTSYFAVMEKQDTFKWATDVVFTNTDPTENAVHSYTAPKKIIRDDYLPLSGGELTGDLVAPHIKHSQSGTLLVENTSSGNSLTIADPEIVKYSQLYMAASWAERETVNFCDIIPISAVVAGAVFTKQVYTGTRTYTYTVTCTSSGEFTLTQTNSTGTTGTLRLKLYVI